MGAAAVISYPRENNKLARAIAEYSNFRARALVRSKSGSCEHSRSACSVCPRPWGGRAVSGTQAKDAGACISASPSTKDGAFGHLSTFVEISPLGTPVVAVLANTAKALKAIEQLDAGLPGAR
jgi:hypothetical protein